MARLTSIFFGLLAALFVSAAPAPNVLENRDLLGEIIDALGIGLVTKINATITLDTLVTNLLFINFEAQNPLIFELTIDQVSSTAGINGTEYAAFNYTFPTPVVVPPLGTANSGSIPNVLLTQGAIASLNIIPLGYLDLLNVNVNVRALTIDGKLGIPLVITGLHQNNVSTTYNLDLTD
ncbi:hypothetical protein DFH07DRAFT_957759 [Mycena maculata]|uniref:Uncharacterized protein n=1 Tax=Mycena maculata TaxID=230809 RepID=A0AAD7NHG3_9AGAR|nr:hypothetical protein DFH07DRAFT_957759 [Mycena maculata]